MGGYAGTGKTTLMSMLQDKLNSATIAYCAYTGKAASVLRKKLNEHNQDIEMNCSVSTIHSLIYKPKLDAQGHVAGWAKKPNIDADLVVIDEASMIGQGVHEDLLSYGVPLLYVGDHGQLPPINESFNLMQDPMLRLETPHRFSENSPLIKLSMLARLEGRIPFGQFSDNVKKLPRSEISKPNGDIEKFVKSKSLLDGSAVIVCGFNKTRIGLNAKIRDYNDFAEHTPMIGDRVICLKNNKRSNVPLYNGAHGTLRHIVKNPRLEYANSVIEMDGVNEDMFRGKMLYGAFAKEKFNSYETAPGQEVFDYGYAITAHKSQGSEFEKVMVIEEGKYVWRENWNKWLYTAVTRSSGQLLIVG
jgi:exodeoxyribonuclease-5|tara:strand:- start:2846 stop:3922 length:1077 start_codon:yes stop_codon:yes gene_type:complete